MYKFLFLAAVAAVLVSCKKSQTNPSAPQTGKITGTWAYVSVTTVFRDTTGRNLNGGNIYPTPPNSYYQFNANGTWGVTFFADNPDNFYNQGFYVQNSDTSFTLSDTGKYAYTEVCKIDSLSAHLFVFRHKRNVMINGVTPATEDYILRLTK